MPQTMLDLMALTPVRRTTHSPSKRKITPSPELGRAKKRIAILVAGTLSPSPALSPPSHAALSPARHLLPETVEITKHDQASATSSLHVILPFDLSQDPDEFFTAHGTEALKKVFPGTKAFAFNNAFLVFYLTELPVKPWPKTVAGAPCYLTTNRADTGPLHNFVKGRVRSKIKIMENIDAQGKTNGCNFAIFDANVKEIFAYFREVGIKVKALQNWDDFLVIVLEDEDQIKHPKLPATVMWLPCYVITKEDVRFGCQPALRRKEPNNIDQIDDSNYQTLRPGVLLTCEKSVGDEALTTSSGVMVRDSEGKEYLTAASHGFPNWGGVVHPGHDGRVIGHVVQDFSPKFDVALVDLDNRERFLNETFDSAEDELGVKLSGLASIRSTRRMDVVEMNNPYMGLAEGSIIGNEYEEYILVEGESPSHWISTSTWVWTGQDSADTMKDGISGTPLTNNKSEVVGFFQYVGVGDMKDFAYFTAAENLIKRGYELA